MGIMSCHLLTLQVTLLLYVASVENTNSCFSIHDMTSDVAIVSGSDSGNIMWIFNNLLSLRWSMDHLLHEAMIFKLAADVIYSIKGISWTTILWKYHTTDNTEKRSNWKTRRRETGWEQERETGMVIDTKSCTCRDDSGLSVYLHKQNQRLVSLWPARLTRDDKGLTVV